MSEVVNIAAILTRLGFRDETSQAAARREMEGAFPPLTRAGKQNIHSTKVPRVRELLAGRQRRCVECFDGLGSDDAIRVAAIDCDVCGGSRQVCRIARSARSAWAARAAGMSRIVLVGGSPASDREVETVLTRADLQVRVVSADSPVNARRAREAECWADIVLLRCPTEIQHSTTDLFQRSRKVTRVVTRGLDGVATALHQAALDRGSSYGA